MFFFLSLKGDNDRYQVQLTYESGTAQELSVEAGDLVQFLEESENGHWWVLSTVSIQILYVPAGVTCCSQAFTRDLTVISETLFCLRYLLWLFYLFALKTHNF